MDTLQDTYGDDEDRDEAPPLPATAPPSDSADQPPSNTADKEAETSENLSSDDAEKSSKPAENVDEEEDPPPKKQKQLSSLANPDQSSLGPVVPKLEIDNNTEEPAGKETAATQTTSGNLKKTKKKNNNVWVTKTTRKGKKKGRGNTINVGSRSADDTVLITPVPRFLDRTDDTPEMKICLSKVYKAEKVELSEDRLSAGSTKGYRMVRATRGVMEGAWYFEIKVVHLGETGHTRLGWATEKGDLQAPVGYDENSFGYRDIDGSKIHKALRENYGKEGYKEGDVIGFYINLPNGSMYAPKAPNLVCYKGQRYAAARDRKEDPPMVVPGSVMSFFKNGICQGVAFKDLFGGRYYPAASMYTLPEQPNCTVKFNFGPEFEFFPEDFGGHPVPKPMIDVPYHGYDNRAEADASESNKE